MLWRARFAIMAIALIAVSTSAHSRFLGADIEPEQPRPGQSATLIVYDDPNCFGYSPDLNGVTHELRRDGYVIEFDLLFAGPCSIPTDEVDEHIFDTGSLVAPGEYQLRIYNGFTAGGTYTFPVDPEDRELIYESTFIVGGEPIVIPAFGWIGLLFLIAAILAISYSILRSRMTESD